MYILRLDENTILGCSRLCNFRIFFFKINYVPRLILSPSVTALFHFRWLIELWLKISRIPKIVNIYISQRETTLCPITMLKLNTVSLISTQGHTLQRIRPPFFYREAIGFLTVLLASLLL